MRGESACDAGDADEYAYGRICCRKYARGERGLRRRLRDRGISKAKENQIFLVGGKVAYGGIVDFEAKDGWWIGLQ